MNDRHPSRQELARIDLFDAVDVDAFQPLLDGCAVRVLQPNEVLLRTGQPNDKLYILLGGRLQARLADGSDVRLAPIEPGQCVGELSVIDGQPATVDVLAERPSRLLVIDQDAFWQLVDRSHPWCRNLLKLLARRLRYDTGILREYEHRSTVDALTGLYNRRWLETILPRQMQRCRHDRLPLAVLMVDIDHFKRLNDTYGHQAGDEALYAVARGLREHLRPEDMVARYGGEEMTAILPATDATAARQVAERLREEIGTTSITLADGRMLAPVTVSIGLAQMWPGAGADALLARADAALYQAKRSGRNRVVVASPSL